MKTKQQKIDFQNKKLIDFDNTTKETAYEIGRIDISTAAEYEKERRIKRFHLEEKVIKAIEKCK